MVRTAAAATAAWLPAGVLRRWQPRRVPELGPGRGQPRRSCREQSRRWPAARPGRRASGGSERAATSGCGRPWPRTAIPGAGGRPGPVCAVTRRAGPSAGRPLCLCPERPRCFPCRRPLPPAERPLPRSVRPGASSPRRAWGAQNRPLRPWDRAGCSESAGLGP